jgi:putative two-component system response regulator
MTSPELQPVPANTTILVVDDLDVIRLSLKAILSNAGYRVLAASSIAEAIALLGRESVQLVLCDIQLPGESGLDLVRHVQPRFPELAVIMVSAMGDTATALDCLQLGAFGFVLKPFQQRDIIVQVNGALRRQMLEIAFRDREELLQQKVREQTEELRNSREEIAFRLVAASEHRDRETGMHVRRIGLYAAEMAALLGWNRDQIDTIRAAAPMHDIGKIGVPDAILQKPGALTDGEWILMRQHTKMGAQILEGSKVPFIQMASNIAVGHHEKYDGTGYPNGLKGEEIPIEARITALVDVFDALSSKRHYKAAWADAEVEAFIREKRGNHFDPLLCDLFLAHLPRFQTILRAHPDESKPASTDQIEARR